MEKKGTLVAGWPLSGEQQKTKLGYRLYRVGSLDGSRYYTEDMDQILAIITKRCPKAHVWESSGIHKDPVPQMGSNYVMISAPKNALRRLQRAAADINAQITHCTEEEARRGKWPKKADEEVKE